ncbi:hypothetical protein GGD41_007094 [Paraburkholderia bryophila]|uniref:Uncharacterized protein n=1 Tax=Paraburkholderia bryophila TaxID=420952 RepID=A0A7Z0B3A0_9BURK|nr:hypothetical protein [Paraburkholderia bryophila]
MRSRVVARTPPRPRNAGTPALIRTPYRSDSRRPFSTNRSSESRT